MTDHMIRHALADLRASVARLEAALDPSPPAAPTELATESPHQPESRAAVAFQTAQARLAALDAWPAVAREPWLNEDSLGLHPLGAHLGDDFSAGLVSVCLELEVDTAPWLAAAALGGGVSVPLAVLLEALPGTLALLADERVRTLLAWDG